ncbi:hypothetical protein CY34DRAFT_811481 [Suillus luteus UH-Slu-Lm8-n1]|uniref:Uncharacterized protein n=1 Tax=Suillus luteus UH-Slu-Lm8-n1 TaxID=930992 RepID=A0A0C9ZFF8_9AGAM|nr:hypothetical protein CY34DRAFT_811481 [Suillus luteus UH-Slu-Lm8-n1]
MPIFVFYRSPRPTACTTAFIDQLNLNQTDLPRNNTIIKGYESNGHTGTSRHYARLAHV